MTNPDFGRYFHIATGYEMLRWLAMSLGLLAGTVLSAQEALLSVRADERPAALFLADLSRQAGVNIIFSDDVVSRVPAITLEMTGVTLREVLDRVLPGRGIRYRYVDDSIVLYAASAEKEYRISGMVIDSVTGEPLISAYIADALSGKGTTTNHFGYFHLVLPEGQVHLAWGYLGYAQGFRHLVLDQNRILTLRLQPNSILQEVVVNADPTLQAGQVHVPSAERITLADLQRSVHLGGASDLYRAADFIPGIRTGTDGIGGIQVRGGGNEQNLILMDGVPVYHPNHLLGIVSVFNYQVLQQASIYKANFPSRYAGRLSSVMDVRTRDGNIKRWGVSGAVGVSEGSLTVEGPLVKDRLGLLVSGRIFLPGLFMPDLTRPYKERNGLGGSADFDYHDINAKLTWRLGERDRLYASLYHGADRFADRTLSSRIIRDRDSGLELAADEDFDKRLAWTNRAGVLRWNHILSDKVFANAIVSTSRFVLQSVDRTNFSYSFPGTELDTISGFDTKEFKSGIEDIAGRLEFEIHPSADHMVTTGVYGTRYRFRPKSVTINEESKVGDFYLEEGLVDDIYFSAFNISTFEGGMFAEDRWQVDPRWNLQFGFHLSSFFVQGVRYADPQLRLSAEYSPGETLALQAGYSRMVQYLHLLSSSGIGLPTDLWVPTTSRVSPSRADQYALSLRWQPSSLIVFDASAYYKSMRNLVSYQEGASFLLREGLLPSSIVDAANWENKITTGVGSATGLEMQASVERARFDLKLSATLARSYRQFEGINNGKVFPDRHDRRWSIGLMSTTRLGRKWAIDLQWLYGSGLPITLAESKFFNPGAFFPQVGINYSERNGYRLPAYHRLDLSVHFLLKETPSFYHGLTLNLYNVYNRLNPFYITLVEDPITGEFAYRQFSLFRFFPSVSYRFALR